MLVRPAQIRELLFRYDLAVARQRAALAELMEVTESELLALSHLTQHGQLTPTRLGRLMQLSSAGVTALVRRLVASGHVTRTSDSSDRRKVQLRVAPDTWRRAAELDTPIALLVDELVAGMSTTERQSLERFVSALVAAIEEQASDLVDMTQERRHETALEPLLGRWG